MFKLSRKIATIVFLSLSFLTTVSANDFTFNTNNNSNRINNFYSFETELNEKLTQRLYNKLGCVNTIKELDKISNYNYFFERRLTFLEALYIIIPRELNVSILGLDAIIIHQNNFTGNCSVELGFDKTRIYDYTFDTNLYPNKEDSEKLINILFDNIMSKTFEIAKTKKTEKNEYDLKWDILVLYNLYMNTDNQQFKEIVRKSLEDNNLDKIEISIIKTVYINYWEKQLEKEAIKDKEYINSQNLNSDSKIDLIEKIDLEYKNKLYILKQTTLRR